MCIKWYGRLNVGLKRTIVTTCPTIGITDPCFQLPCSRSCFSHSFSQKQIICGCNNPNKWSTTLQTLNWVENREILRENKAYDWLLSFYDNGINCNQMEHCEWDNQIRKHGKAIDIQANSWPYAKICFCILHIVNIDFRDSLHHLNATVALKALPCVCSQWEALVVWGSEQHLSG